MERMGLSKKNAERNIRKAIMHGRRATEYSGRARQYLESAVFGNAYALVYKDFCYVISIDNGNCITTFRLPSWWKYVELQRKHDTKYTRINSPYYDNGPTEKHLEVQT